MAESSEIYEFIAARGVPSKLPGLWSRFKCHNAFFAGALDAAQTLSDLRTKFKDEDLVKARVVLVDPQGNVSLNPRLRGADAMILALRKKADQMPFDFWDGMGSIVKTSWPVLGVLKDYRIPPMSRDGSPLFVAFSIADVAALWTMGLPATLPFGLDAFAGQDITTFCKRFGLRRYRSSSFELYRGGLQDASDAEEEPPPLTFVDWSPSLFVSTESPKLGDIRRHISNLHRHLGIEFGDLSVWKPTEADLERLRFCVTTGDGKDVREALVDSVDEYSEKLIEAVSVRVKAPQTVAQALRAWTTVQNSSGDVTGRKQAWDNLESILERDVIAPLLQHADEATDPMDRNLVLSLADLSRMLHPQAIVVATRFANAISESRIRASTELPADELEQVLAMTDRILALTQELRRWQPKKKLSIDNSRKTKPVRPALINSDSAGKNSQQ